VNSVNFVYLNSNISVSNPVVSTANVIYLKGNNGKYVTYSGANSLMSSTSLTLGSNEKFVVIDVGNGLVALRGSNGKYVSLNATTHILNCNFSVIGNYQKFTLNDLCGVYSLQGYNDLYVSSENGAASGLTCTRTVASGWEFFNWDITSVEVLSSKSFEDTEASYKIFPNPAQNRITINSVLDEELSIVVYDESGREVIKTTTSGKQKSIDISKIQGGIYFMKIVGLEKTETIKFFINHK